MFIFFFWSTIVATPCGRPADIFNRLPPPPGFFFFRCCIIGDKGPIFSSTAPRAARPSARPLCLFFGPTFYYFCPYAREGSTKRNSPTYVIRITCTLTHTSSPYPRNHQRKKTYIHIHSFTTIFIISVSDIEYSLHSKTSVLSFRKTILFI